MLIENNQYSVIQKALLRFFLIYFILYIIPYGFEYIPIDTDDYSLWEPITIWFGETFLGWDFNLNRLAKGFDSKYDYSRFALITVISFGATLLWLLLDRLKAWEYNTRLKAILQTILRYHLGFTLILYGMAKVFPLQFGTTGIDTLTTDFGDFRPMSLLWAFMSYSRFYTGVTGWVEVLGGLFLLFRKTTFLGIFLSFVAMVNVVVIDIGYDVTVKMFAMHLLIMAAILMADHFNRVMNFLLLNREAKPLYYFNLFSGLPKVGMAMKIVVIAIFGYFTFTGTAERLNNETANRYGAFSSTHHVEQMIINGDTLDASSFLSWKQMNISGRSYLSDQLTITTGLNSKKNFRFEMDSVEQTLTFKDLNVGSDVYEFSYQKTAGKRYLFKGTHLGDSIILQTKAKVADDYTLMSNKRRWIRDLR